MQCQAEVERLCREALSAGPLVSTAELGQASSVAAVAAGTSASRRPPLAAAVVAQSAPAASPAAEDPPSSTWSSPRWWRCFLAGRPLRPGALARCARQGCSQCALGLLGVASGAPFRQCDLGAIAGASLVRCVASCILQCTSGLTSATTCSWPLSQVGRLRLLMGHGAVQMQRGATSKQLSSRLGVVVPQR